MTETRASIARDDRVAPAFDNPEAYIPNDRRRALASGERMPDRVEGAALFADISGFTPLTEALAREFGPQRGAEELTSNLNRVFHAIIGVLAVIVGFALLRTPFQSVEVLIFVLGVFWLVQGIMTFVAAFSVKQGRNWGIFIGILGVLAGIVILAYPIDSALTLAFIGGIWLVILGIMQIVAGFQLRRAHQVLTGAAAA